MPSVVTNDFRKRLLDLFKTDIARSTTNYYIGLARADSDVSIIEANSLYSQNQVRHTLQSVKRLSNVSFVIPTVEWGIGETYEAWSDKNYDQTNFYVVNANTNEVFICVDTAKNAEGVVQVTGVTPPTAALANNEGKTFVTPDGYLWRYMYKISNVDYAKYRSNSYIPVKSLVSSSFITEDAELFTLQTNATDGEIIRIEFDSAGSFTSTPTITINGNGDSASFSVTLDDSAIAYISIDSDQDGNFLHGSGYDYASATLSAGNVTLRPVLAPKGGLNANPIESLKARSIMLQLDIQGNESGTLLTDNDFRQIVLFEDLKKYGSDSDFIANTGNAMRSWNITDLTLQLIEDETFFGQTSGAKGKLFVHNVGSKIYYYQNVKTGFKSFTIGEIIEGETSGQIATINSANNPDVDAYSGEILYINNVTTAVERANNQSEDIRIVIQLG